MLSVRLFHMGIVEGKKEASWYDVQADMDLKLFVGCDLVCVLSGRFHSGRVGQLASQLTSTNLLCYATSKTQARSLPSMAALKTTRCN